MSHLPETFDWLTATEGDRARAMTFSKRRSEWLLTRWVAKGAVAALLGWSSDAASLRRIEIRALPSGEARGAPEVLVDAASSALKISLTSRAGMAACVLGDAGDLGEGCDVGCDLELVEPRTERFVRDYFTVDERAAVAGAIVDASRDVLANVIWSAKESALKAQRTGLRRDTRSVEVGFRGPSVAGWGPLSVSTAEGHDLAGWWRRYGEFLITVVTGRELPPPRPLTEPPPLSTARPSHDWEASPLAGDL